MAGGLSGGDGFRAQLNAYEKSLDKAGTLAVGFLENARYPDGTPVAMVAAVQNFGSPAKGIPPRAFFSHMIQRNEASWPKRFTAIIRSEMANNGTFDVTRALTLMGKGMEGQLVQAINETNGPALSPVTLMLRKWFPTEPWRVTFADVQRAREAVAAGEDSGRSGTGAKPLVWSGTLRNSIDSEVTT